MSIPFARSLRSMQHDRFQPGMIAIVMIGLILAFWMIWFFTGDLPVYAVATGYSVQEDGLLFANFPSASLPNIFPGQQAELLLSPQDGKAIDPIAAEVMNVPTDAAEPVEIYPLTSEPLSGSEQGQLKILVGQVSPAALVWQSIQQ